MKRFHRNWRMSSLCRTLYRYVDWNSQIWVSLNLWPSRTLYRYVDWNILSGTDISGTYSRTLYRYVDWNWKYVGQRVIGTVVPYIGTWIETRQRYGGHPSCYVVPYIGTWIETLDSIDIFRKTMCRTLYRYVDWNWRFYLCFLRRRKVVPYIGTWIETLKLYLLLTVLLVVPYIGTWIETCCTF